MGPYLTYDLLQTKREMCTKFGSDRFRNVNLYKFHTNKQTFIFIYNKVINFRFGPIRMLCAMLFGIVRN